MEEIFLLSSIKSARDDPCETTFKAVLVHTLGNGCGGRTGNNILIQTQIELFESILINGGGFIKGGDEMMQNTTVGQNTQCLVILHITH